MNVKSRNVSAELTAFLQIKEFQAQFPPPLPPISSELLLLSGGPAHRFKTKPVKANSPFLRHTLSAPLLLLDTYSHVHFIHRTWKTCFWGLCPRAHTCFTWPWHHTHWIETTFIARIKLLPGHGGGGDTEKPIQSLRLPKPHTDVLQTH